MLKPIAFFFLVLTPLSAAINVPLTVQEALYAGGSAGIARAAEPFCMGVPLADSAAISSPAVLGLAGSAAGQFRVLGSWPDGNVKWVKVCGIVPVLNAGGTATLALTDSGTGNFGGPALAVDNGATITVSTGTATFTIKKARFNGIDSVSMGGAAVVASSSDPTRGLVLMGPDPAAAFPANVTCGAGAGQSPCTTLFSSANDPNSTAVIEENGPVMTVIRATGNHVDSAGHVYMQYTARLTFYKGKSTVKATTILRNANYDTSATPSPDLAGNTFNTAYKGFQSYELRVAPNLSGPLRYTIATDQVPQTGELSGSDSAYVYQAQSKFMIAQEAGSPSCNYQSACANTYTTDTGYTAYRNDTLIASGDASTVIGGWADVSDASGVGVEIGVYQMSAYWPKSLEFNNGGADVRIGIWPRENSQPVYQAWPAWSIHDLFLEFHTSAPASFSDEFLKLQHYLVARPTPAYVNSTKVFPYPIVDPGTEDSYYLNVAASATPAVSPKSLCWAGAPPCTPDRSVSSLAVANSMNVSMYRNYTWGVGGPLNQEEFRWADLQKFLQRGFTGRFLTSAHFYRFLAEKAWAHDDGVSEVDSSINGFHWRDRIHASKPGAELDAIGNPTVACGQNKGCAKLANSSKSFVDWVTSDAIHTHWYGMPDYYFLTGDETMREAMDPMKNYYMNMDTYQAASFNGLSITRAIGIELLGAARFSEYLKAVGDPDYTAVLTQGQTAFNKTVKPDVCLSGYPKGCTPPPLSSFSSTDPVGISRVRGVHMGSRSQGWCPHATPPAYIRQQESFMTSILIEGILAFRDAMGPAWGDYQLALDLAYGASQWALTEAYNDDGTANWQSSSSPLYNGFRYLVPADFANVCPAGTPVQSGYTVQVGNNVFDNYTFATPGQSVWFNFYAQYLMNGTTDWERQMKIQMAQVGVHKSAWPADFGSYQLGLLIDLLSRPSRPVLQDVPFTVTDNGDGSYTLAWTVPSGAQSYRIKWSPKWIAPSSGLLGFENVYTNSFALDPEKYATWFGANNVTEPPPGSPGQTQRFLISAGVAGLTAANFSLKAYVAGGTPPPAGPARLAAVSGNGQAGTVSSPLASPLVVAVTDSAGAPVSGVSVGFSVTAGGGSLSATTVTTDANGLAAAVLTLGATAGTNTVAASSGTLAGSPITFSATATAAASASLTLVSGNGQSGSVGQALANPFVVKATDSTGKPMQGVSVAFTATAGSGALSATVVSTDSAGLASTVLTLGPTAGANIVTATSGTLAGSPITFTATGVTSAQTGAVTWSQPPVTTGWPNGNGWLTLHYDPVSSRIILYGVPPGSTSIYSSDLLFYNTATNIWTRLGGTGAMADTCTLDTPTQPGERHPNGQMAVDTKRNLLWLYGGVNQRCTGAPPDTSPRRDTYYLTLNPDPLADTWHQVSTAHFPSAAVNSSMIYDPDDDVLFAYGYDGSAATSTQWIYCRTAENPTPGTPTALQVAAGCVNGDDWNEINHGSNHPPANSYVRTVYDPVNKNVLLYGGTDGGGLTHYNQTWTYDIPTHVWTQKCQGGCVAPPVDSANIPIPALVYNSSTRMALFHQSSGAGAPADWQYDPSADAWTKLTSAGTAPAQSIAMAFDPGQNKLVGWYQGAGALLWLGTLGGSVTAGPAANLVIVSGNNQTGTAGGALAAPFAVRVTDSSGIPVSGTSVTFTVTSGGGALSATAVTTDSAGLASTLLTLGPSAGSNTVSAASATLAGSPVTFTATAAPATRPAAALTLVSGDGQTGNAGQPLPIPLTVKVTDTAGNPVSGITVVFTVTSGGGTVASSSIPTDMSGLASTVLTLGPSAGANIVTASSGTLAGSPVTFKETANVIPAGATVTWAQMPTTPGWPGGSVGAVLPFDPVSGQTVLYGYVSGATTSYASDLYFYNSAGNTWTHANGTGAAYYSCTPDQVAQPGERIPAGQMAIDTTRNFLWMFGGANGKCNGAAPNVNPRRDTYYLALAANPANSIWRQVTTAHFPTAAVSASLVYDPDDDVLFAFGYDGGASTSDQWIYCRTSENATPGVPSARQLAAGCANGDDWNEVNHAGFHPLATAYTGMVYDPVGHKALLYGGADVLGTRYNQTWAYDVPTRTWTQRCAGTCEPPPVSTAASPIPPALVYNPTTQKVWLHQTSVAGATADWQYDPAADTWTTLTSAGAVPPGNVSLAFDSAQNRLIALTQGPGAQVWQGQFPPVAGPAAVIASVSGDAQTGTVGMPLANPLVVRVTDTSGKPSPGAAVNFAITAGGGFLSTSSVNTDANGLASVILTLGPVAGPNTVTATSAQVPGSRLSFNHVAVPGPPATLLEVSGNRQIGTAGQPLLQPFVVKGTDLKGNPVSGVPVNFTVTGGGGNMSARSVLTDSGGIALSTLTPGPIAGTQAVAVASGTLSGSPVTFTAATLPGAGVTWNRLAPSAGWPGGNGYLSILYDPVSQQTVLYAIAAKSTSTNSTDLFFFDSGSRTFTRLGGTGSMSTACPADTATTPGDRNPFGQMTIDTRRNFLWIYGGTCGGSVRQDMYYLTLNSNPASDVWHRVTPAHLPAPAAGATMTYDPDDDVLLAVGYDLGPNTKDTWVYCRTAENAVPGTPTARQLSAGCALPDDWNLVAVTANGHTGLMHSALVYDTVTRKAIQYGGATPAGVAKNLTWAYDVPTRTWTQKALATTPPPVTKDNYPKPALAYNTRTHKLLYHLTTGGAAPADYQYDPVMDVWTVLVSSGTGAAAQQALAYDAKNDLLVGWREGTTVEMWLGALSGLAAPFQGAGGIVTTTAEPQY